MSGDRLPPPGGPAVRPGWFLAAWAGLTLANVILAVGVQPPRGPLIWAAEVFAALLVSLAETLVIARLALEVIDALRNWWDRAGPVARRVVAVAVSILCTIPVTAAVGWVGLAVRAQLAAGLAHCPDPTTVTVLTNADFRASVTAAARRYERETADGGCPSIAVHVTETDRAQAREALRQGWPDGAFQAIGPRPDLWVADRGVDLAPAAAQLPGPAAAALTSAPVVAHSAVVLATAGAAGQPGPMAWRDAVERMRTLGRPVIRPEPGASAVGELALLHDYADQRSTPEGGVDRVAQRYESEYAASFSETGWRRADVPAVLRDARAALCGPAASPARQAVFVLPAFLTTAAAHPVGVPPADGLGADVAGCPADQWPALETFPVTDQEVDVELAVARLPWPGARDPEAEAAADRFRDWLDGDSGEAALAALGWEPRPAARPTDPQRALAALDRYQAARTTARTMLAVDTSESMQALRPEVTAVVTTLVSQLGPADQVGLFGFIRPTRGADQITPVVELGPTRDPRARTSRATRILDWLGGHQPVDGDTPLRAALTYGTAALPAASRPELARDTLLVITDGRDLVDVPAWPAVVTGASAAGVQIIVLTVGDRSALPADVPATRVQIVPLTGEAPGQEALRATATVLWRSAP